MLNFPALREYVIRVRRRRLSERHPETVVAFASEVDGKPFDNTRITKPR